jgi:hypothetical protein
MIARPAPSRPTVTGDICRRPSRRHVVRTAFSCSRRNCCARAISIGILLLWETVRWGGGQPSPSSLGESVTAMRGAVLAGTRRKQSTRWGREGDTARRVQPQRHQGETSEIKNAVLVLLSCTNIVLSGSDISVTRDATTYGRSLRAALQCSSCVARQNRLKRWASPRRCRAPRVPRGRPHRGRRAHIDTHVDLLPTPSYGATPARAGRQRGDFRRDSVLAV